MKKLRSLALALCLGLALPAAAADVAAVDAPSAVSAGGVTAAVRADGSLWVWDAEGEQQGGERDGIFVKLMDGVASVSCGSNASGAVKTDGTLWMWGEHVTLGDGTGMTQVSAPVKVMDGVAAVHCGANTAVIKTDGTLWAWGYENSSGDVGSGTTDPVLVPTKILDDVVAFCSNGGRSAAIKSDGTLWMWGYLLPGEAGSHGWSDTPVPTVPTQMLAGVAVPEGLLPTVAGFSDVHEGDYYADAVVWAKERGVTGGTSADTFSPDRTVTRAEAVTFLWRAAGSPRPASAASPFADVTDSGAYYYAAVLWAYEQGIVGGVGNRQFSLYGTLTYDQILAMLCRAAGGSAAGGDWSSAAVDWAAENGLTDGLTFSAKDSCPRADVVYCLWKQLA